MAQYTTSQIIEGNKYVNKNDNDTTNRVSTGSPDGCRAKKHCNAMFFFAKKCTRRVQRHTDRHEVRHDGSPCRFVVRSMLGSTVPGPCVAAARHDTGVWRTGMSTVPAAPPIKYVLGYRSRTLTLNPNPNPNPNPNHNPKINTQKTKRHRNEIEHRVISKSRFPTDGVGL